MNWEEVPWRDGWRSSQCFACGRSFPEIPPRERWGDKGEGLSGRYECTVCRRHFCIDCDLFAHEVVHNCPGCQSGRGVGGSAKGVMESSVDVVLEAEKGNVDANGNGVVAGEVMNTG